MINIQNIAMKQPIRTYDHMIKTCHCVQLFANKGIPHKRKKHEPCVRKNINMCFVGFERLFCFVQFLDDGCDGRGRETKLLLIISFYIFCTAEVCIFTMQWWV